MTMIFNSCISEVGDAIRPYNKDIHCYVFGSSLENPSWSDVDILFTYTCDYQLNDLKIAIREVEEKYPMDLTFMTVDEEKELNFIEIVKAIPIEKAAFVS